MTPEHQTAHDVRTPPTCYLPLREDANEIRLLSLREGATSINHEAMSCSLTVFSLDNAPQFTALSYQWLDTHNTKLILVNDYQVHVGKNAYAFLKQYHASCESGYIWIDALCINQRDPLERGQQVGLMGRLYSRAERVISWLGVGSLAMRQAARHLASLKTKISQIGIEAHLSMPLHLLHGDKRRRLVGKAKIKQDLFALHVETICRATYWTRLWIIQEILLAVQLEIWCADVRFAFDIFIVLYDLARDMAVEGESTARLTRQQFFKNCQAAEIINVKRRWYRDGARSFSSSELFKKFGDAGCADVKDRVYGLLGLLECKELENFPIKPDYRLTASELFLELCMRHVRKKIQDRGLLSVDIPWQYCRSIYISIQGRLELDDEDENVKLVEQGIFSTL